MDNSHKYWLGAAVLGLHTLFKEEGKKKVGDVKVDFLIWLLNTFNEGGTLPGSNEKLTKASNASLVTVSDTMKGLRELGLVQKIDGNYILAFSRESIL